MNKPILRSMEDYLDNVGLTFCSVCKHKNDCYVKCRQRDNLIDRFEPDNVFTALSKEAQEFNEAIAANSKDV